MLIFVTDSTSEMVYSSTLRNLQRSIGVLRVADNYSNTVSKKSMRLHELVYGVIWRH